MNRKQPHIRARGLVLIVVGLAIGWGLVLAAVAVAILRGYHA